MKPIRVFLLLSSALLCCTLHRVEYVLITDDPNDCKQPFRVGVQYRRPMDSNSESWSWESLMNVEGLFKIMHEHMICYLIFHNRG